MKVAIKLGGSIITDKSQFKTPNLDNISSIVDLLSKLYKEGINFIIVHGAGSYAHIPAKKYNLSNGYSGEEGRIHYSEVHALCEELSLLIVNKLIEKGIPAVSFHPATYVTQRDKKPTSIQDNLLMRYLKEGFVPVTHGDVVLDDSIKSSIISGDELMKHFGKTWADKLVFISDVDGLLDKFPGGNLIPIVNSENFKDVLVNVGGSEHTDVTGGMANKVKDLMELPVPTYLVNGAYPSRIENAIRGNPDVYTLFEVDQ